MIFDFVTNKIFKKLLDGKIAAGDSNKLGGKGADEYNLGELTISEKALDTLGTDYSIPNTWTYIGFITPTEKFDDSGWLMGGGRFTIIGAYYDGYKNGVQTIIGSLGIKQRVLNTGTWSEWKLIGSDLANYHAKDSDGRLNVDCANNDPVNLTVPSTSDYNLIRFYKGTSRMGLLGFKGVDNPSFMTSSGTVYSLLHSGNVGSYALPIGGGMVGDGTRLEALKTKGTTEAFHGFYDKDNGTLGFIGFDTNKKLMYKNASYANKEIHHDGNSAKVVFTEDSTTPPPSDALWAHL